MARVTLVVNSVREASGTFLHGLTGRLVRSGHTVTVHELMPETALMSTEEAGDGYSSAVTRSRAFPPVRSLSFATSVGRKGLRDRDAIGRAMRRSRRQFGSTSRSARAALLAAPILATRPDVVHLSFSPIGVALLDGLELLDGTTRLIVSCRGTGGLVRPVLDPDAAAGLVRLLERVDAVHAVSDDIASAVRSLAANGPEIHVIRPAVDTEVFQRVTPRRPIGSPVEVVTVSRLHWVKAIDVQLAAAARLLQRGLALRWTIVGDGPERDPLRFRAHALGLQDVVEFAGGRPPGEVRRLVEASDIFVLSSLSEGTSNAVLEAMALEVPVISTAVGGMIEVFHDGDDAVLVPPGDAVALENAVLRLANADGDTAAMGSRARRTVMYGFSAKLQGRKVDDLYRSVLASSASTVRRQR